MRRFHTACWFVCVLAVLIGTLPVRAGAQEPWPNNEWRTASPEEQGMSSDTLVALVEIIPDKDIKIRNIIIVRNGRKVLDASFAPYPQETPHIIHSCTKTITATLIGIAIDKGYLDSVDQKVLDFFPGKKIDNRDAAKEKMTIEHLLTMSTGFQCEDSYKFEWAGLRTMMRQPIWADYVLGLPMIHEPGERFEYCNGASYLLTAILQKATGMTALDFANENLFGPLGITGVEWMMDRSGINTGWGNIVMAPADLAKIGYLFLHKGNVDGKQIVSREWMEESVKPHIVAGTLSDSYGYQVWPNDMGYYMMLGHAGQYVFVHPDENMVTVVTSCLESRKFFVPRQLYHDFILLSVVDDKPLSPDSEGARRLAEVIDDAANPEPQPVPALPGMAAEISGKRFDFDANAAGFQWIELEFEPGKNEAAIEASLGFRHIEADVGLDGVHRLSDAEGLLQAYKGPLGKRKHICPRIRSARTNAARQCADGV